MSANLSLKVHGYELSVRRFSVREALSTPFEVTVWAKLADDDVDLEKVVGGPATFTIAMDRRSRSWFGAVRHAEQAQAESTGLSTYVFRIVPALWLSSQVSNHRIFQHKNLPDIIDEVLEPYQIKPTRELGGIYPDKEYIVQSGETDYDFIHRLLEEAGITYFYRFEGDKPKLVFSDGPHQSSPRPGDPIHHVDEPNAEAKEDYVTRVRLAHQVCPGKATVRDFDFQRRPDYPLMSTIETRQDPEQAYEQYVYEPGACLVEKGGRGSRVADDQGIAWHDPDENMALAGRVLMSARRHKRSVGFTTNAMDLAPGVIFKMTNHPHPSLDEAKELLVGEFTLDGTPTGEWLFQGVATLAEDGHPLHLKTPRRRVAGVHTAVVIGPKGEEIYTDEYGRVRVQFPWDREGEGISEGTPSSTWMRVSQPWAGGGYGTMNIPRIGQEVLVRYFEGDPEQPAVVGRVYNKLQPVPYPLPKHKAKSIWKSDTSPHEDNAYNEIRLDDRKGSELFYLQAQRDRQQLIKRHATERTGENRVGVVGHSRSGIVGQTETVLVGKQHSVQMIKPPSEEDMKVLPQKKPKLEPLPTKLDMVDKKLLSATSSTALELDDAEVIFEAKGEISIHAKGGSVVIEGGPKIKINCSGGGAGGGGGSASGGAPAPGPEGGPSPGPFSWLKEKLGFGKPKKMKLPAPKGADVSSMLSDFDADTQAMVRGSPTLSDQLNELEEDGWVVEKGEEGKGSWCDSSAKKIVVDGSRPPDRAASTIAHEAGHAQYGAKPYHSPKGKTRDEYVGANVQEALTNEGNAQFNSNVAREEILANGGADIGIPGNGDYTSSYDDYKAGKISKDEAVGKMAEEMGNEKTSTTGQNYKEYYGENHEKHWDSNIAPTLPTGTDRYE